MSDTVRNLTMDNLRSLISSRTDKDRAGTWVISYGGLDGTYATYKTLFQDHNYKVDDNGIYEVREGYSVVKQYLP